MYTPLVAALFLFGSIITAAAADCPADYRGAYDADSCYMCPSLDASLDRSTSITRCHHNDGQSFMCLYTSRYVNLNGNCVYDIKGRKRGGSKVMDCPSRSREDQYCFQRKAKGTYLIKCQDKGCDYQTETCYTCPTLGGTQTAHVDTRAKELKCMYYGQDTSKNLNTCEYNPSNGKLIASLNGSPRCGGTAPVDLVCKGKLDFQKKMDAAAKKVAPELEEAKKVKEFEANRTPLDMLCQAVVRNFTNLPLVKLVKLDASLCREPEKAIEKLDKALILGEVVNATKVYPALQPLRKALVEAFGEP